MAACSLTGLDELHINIAEGRSKQVSVQPLKQKCEYCNGWTEQGFVINGGRKKDNANCDSHQPCLFELQLYV